MVGFRFGFTPGFLDVLIRLSDAEWHHSHEDVVLALDELHDERGVEPLYRAALKEHPYLDYDESRALARKAILALGKLGHSAAQEKLKSLAAAENPLVRSYAQKQLFRQNGELPPEKRERMKALSVLIGEERDQTSRLRLIEELQELIEEETAAEQKWIAGQGWRGPNKAG